MATDDTVVHVDDVDLNLDAPVSSTARGIQPMPLRIHSQERWLPASAMTRRIQVDRLIDRFIERAG